MMLAMTIRYARFSAICPASVAAHCLRREYAMRFALFHARAV